jgi:hypothetical protein
MVYAEWFSTIRAGEKHLFWAGKLPAYPAALRQAEVPTTN